MRLRSPIAVIVFLGAVTLLTNGRAAIPPVTAEVLTPVLEARPRQTLNLRLRFDNDSDTWQTVHPELVVPGGWLVLVPAEQALLEPGGSHLALSTILVPANARAGNHTFPLSYYTSQDSTRQQALFRVNVPVVDHAELRALESPEFVATTEFTTTFLLQNLGNTPHEWLLSAKSGLDLEVDVSPESVVLAPGEVAEVTAIVEVPPGLSESKAHTLTITAESRNLPGTGATAISRTYLVPRALPASSALHTFPFTISASYRGGSNTDSNHGPALEISGAGTLTEQGRDRFRVKLRLAVDEVIDELLLEYRRGGVTVRFGHQGFPTSLLTADVTAFGVSARLVSELLTRPYALELHGYAADESYVLGGNLSLRPAEGTEVGVRVNISEAGLLSSLEVMYKPALLDPAAIQLAEFRAAYGVRLAGGQRPGHGLEAQLQLNQGPSFARLRVDGANATFAQRDTHAFSVALDSSLRMNEALRIVPEYPLNFSFGYAASWRWDEALPFLLFPPGDAASHNEKYSLGLNFGVGPLSFSSSFAETFEWGSDGSSRRSDLRGLVRYRASDQTTIAQSVTWTKKWESDQLTASALDYQTAAALATGAAGRLTTSFVGSYDLATGEHRVAAVGLGWSGRPTPDFALQAEGQYYLLHPSRLWSVNLLSAYRFDNDHSIATDVKTKFLRDASFTVAFELSYALPIEVPLGRKEGLGQLTGSITTASGDPLAGLVVTAAGQAVTTDGDGRFAFPAVPVGEHLVQVQLGDSLAPTQLLTPALPHRLSIADRQEATVAFKAIEGAAVTGTVTVLALASGDAAVADDTPVAALGHGVEVELRGASTVLHAVTDKHGSFRFDRLPPGDWSLRVINSGLPSNYRVEPAEQQLQLESGGSAQVTVEFIPIVRHIEISDGGTLLPPAPP